VLPHRASSKEKAILAIYPRSSEWGILAFSRKRGFIEKLAEWMSQDLRRKDNENI